MLLFVIDEVFNRPVVWTVTLHCLFVLVHHVQLFCVLKFPDLLFQQILKLSTNFWTLHVSNIRVYKPLCSGGRIDYLLLIEYQWTQIHWILIGLNWTEHTYGLSVDISPAFDILFISLLFFSFLHVMPQILLKGYCWTIYIYTHTHIHSRVCVCVSDANGHKSNVLHIVMFLCQLCREIF